MLRAQLDPLFYYKITLDVLVKCAFQAFVFGLLVDCSIMMVAVLFQGVLRNVFLLTYKMQGTIQAMSLSRGSFYDRVHSTGDFILMKVDKNLKSKIPNKQDIITSRLITFTVPPLPLKVQ